MSSVPDTGLAAANGGVYAIAQAGELTIVGGTFSKFGGTDRLRVAAVRTSGALDATFRADTDGKVDAIAVSSMARR